MPERPIPDFHIGPPGEMIEIRPPTPDLPFNETEARRLNLERLEVRGNQEAQKLIDQVIDGSIDITTDDGKKQFTETWAVNCPNLPAPCVPDKSYWWYLTQLAKHKIIANLEGPEQPAIPHFDQDGVILVDSWQETNWDAPDAPTKHKSPLLKALLNHESTVNIKRQDLDSALWQGDPSLRIPTPKHKALLQTLGVDPAQFELRPIRQDEYVRLAKTKGWGQKNLSTNFDHYGLEGDGVCGGLRGGNRGLGGPSSVGRDSRDGAAGILAVRLVLARKK